MNRKKINNLVGMSILVALIIILQTIATFIKLGTVPLSLVLIPIVVGAILYGPKVGTMLGGVFGGIVLIYALSGADAFSNLLFNLEPVWTIVLIFVKGMTAGFMSGMLYKLIKKKNNIVAIIVSALICPIVNTGIFLLAMFTIYHSTLVSFAGGENLVVFALVTLVGVNFLFEFLTNAVLSPAIVRIIEIRQTTLSENR